MRVYLDGRKIATKETRSFSTKVSTKKLRSGKHKLKVSARDKKGRTAHQDRLVPRLLSQAGVMTTTGIGRSVFFWYAV